MDWTYLCKLPESFIIHFNCWNIVDYYSKSQLRYGKSVIILNDPCNVKADHLCSHSTHFIFQTHIYLLPNNTWLNVIIFFILTFSVTVHIFNNQIFRNTKSNCKWMIKYSNQITISLIFHQTFVKTLIDHIFYHRLPIYFWFDLNISNNIHHI